MPQFSAVVTTGIYCRPGCPARPNPSNVRRFDLAAAAEASGYRACLRCRPYRSPQVVGWSGPELVCRAVQMVVDGALDDATEDALAARLGTSGRHLRRLFTTHVGVTPDQLARSRRAHFARRLLDDTDLSVTEVAYASGFGSVRQMNRTLLDVFRAAPTELRARRRASDRLVADGGLGLRLPFTGPLDATAMLDYFAARAIPGVESVRDGTYRRTIVVDGDPGVLELRPGGDDHLLLVAHLPHWEGLIHIVERSRRIFGLDFPADEAAAHLTADCVIGPLIAARPGLRLPGTWDPFETGVRAILGQQVSVAGASTIAGRLVERLGTPVPGLTALGLTRTFPTPAEVASADLSGIGLPQARAHAVRAFAAAVASGDIPLDRSASLDDLVTSIIAVPGLGPWTANYLALRLGERDAFPATDLGLRNAYRAATGADKVPASLDAASEPWRPWRAAAAVHLWASLPSPV
ncbi:MAG TPA: AlkA N-terminal domain-containing protein [Acidimicrobiales bacterium]|nr:AlkA N-terminal domain-containing protein [Acidimicrobiales bacterium]